ncbi:ribosomal biogenesis factor-like [Branchiostoma lanceolatum]|uniref:ribosomal biogenesis factor-like n=1 Tax=Branchiostoma lanceolatum TaxID=7740 RepID=UPI003451132F
MGKNRQKSRPATKGGNAGSQPKNVFSVSKHKAMKAKRKAKSIDVKKLNSQVRQEVRRVNTTTANLQEELVRVQKDTETQQIMKTHLKAKPTPGTEQPPPDMEAAALQFAML